jgi:AraC-like DNA-binding protein
MFHQFYQPHPALKTIVNNIMILHCVFDKNNPLPQLPMPPLPEQRLFFYPYDAVEADYFLSDKKIQLHTASLVGPQMERVNIKLGYNHLVIKVGFQPGALNRLLGIPMTEFLQLEAFDASAVLGKAIHSLNEQLKNAASYVDMKNCIDTFLLQRLHKVKELLPVDRALAMLVKGGGLISIDTLAGEACLSNRQFERVIKERIGFSPKFFSRLVRFSNAWHIKENNPGISWTKIAYECGYFDQMHLVKDFKEFAGSNPSKAELEILQMPFNPKNMLHNTDAA